MKLREAMERVDEIRPNMTAPELKIAALSELDGLVWREIIHRHEFDGEEPEMPAYDGNTDPDTVLLVPFPYDNIYTYWLMAKIDEQTLELDKYNNDRIMFNAAWESFSDWWTRSHMPKTNVRELRI